MTDTVSPVRGRPRDAARETEILETALQLVADQGYDCVSMDAVATACKASKATLYRRWPSKAAMVAAALHCRAHHDSETPDTGDLRQDLLLGMQHVVESVRTEDVGLLVGLLNAVRTDPDLAREFRQQMTVDKKTVAADWTQRAIERGQLVPDADLELLHQVAPALVMFRLLLTGEPVDKAFCRRVVDELLMPLIERQTPDAAVDATQHAATSAPA